MSAARMALSYWFDGAREVDDARALLLAALGGEVGGAHGAAVRALLLAALVGEVGGARGAAVRADGARGVGDARALLLAALGGEVGGARGAAVQV